MKKFIKGYYKISNKINIFIIKVFDMIFKLSTSLGILLYLIFIVVLSPLLILDTIFNLIIGVYMKKYYGIALGEFIRIQIDNAEDLVDQYTDIKEESL